MENKQMLEEFLELVQIPVNSRNERQIADVLKAKLEALGLEVTEEDTGAKIGGDAGNIRAVLRGTADCEPLLFSAHMDRVANNHGADYVLHRHYLRCIFLPDFKENRNVCRRPCTVCYGTAAVPYSGC